jgi:hypothetical protein
MNLPPLLRWRSVEDLDDPVALCRAEKTPDWWYC